MKKRVRIKALEDRPGLKAGETTELTLEWEALVTLYTEEMQGLVEIEEIPRDIEKAIEQGEQIVRAEEDLDLNMKEALTLWNRYEDRNLEIGTVDAVLKTIHEAFLVGVVFGREQTK